MSGPNRRLWTGITVYQAGLDIPEPIPTGHLPDKTKEQARNLERNLERFQKKHSAINRKRNIHG